MGTYILKLWAHAEDASIPKVEVEAEDKIRAAALGLKHFKATGRKIPEDGTIDVGNQPLKIEDVLRWLRITEEGQEYASRKSLRELTAS